MTTPAGQPHGFTMAETTPSATTLEMLTRLSRSLDEFLPDHAKLAASYAGTPSLEFVAPEVRAATANRLQTLAPNMSRLVVQAIAERLEVTGFSIGTNEDAGAELWDIWNASGLDLASHLAMEEALVYGRAFVLVWGDSADPTRPVVTVESADEMAVHFDPRTRQVTSALKRFKADDQHGHAYLYEAQQVTHYRTRRPLADLGLTAPLSTSDYVVESVVPNPLGRCPVIPLVARPTLSNLLGTSELADVMPLSKALSKTMTDALVSSEYLAMPRRWVTGLEVQVDAEGRPVDPFGTSPRTSIIEPADARTGSYDSADLSGYSALANLLTSQIGAVSGTPAGYLLAVRDQPASAEALLAAEISLVSKIRARHRTFGDTWAQAMTLAAEIRSGGPRPDLADAVTLWRNPEHPSAAALADAAQKQVALGIPLEIVAGGLLGYSAEEVDEIRAARRREALDGHGLDLTTLRPAQPVTQPPAAPGALPGLVQ